MIPTRWIRSALVGWLTLACASCQGPLLEHRASRCVVAPVSTDELPEAIARRARVRFEAGERSMHLELVLDRRGEDLVVVGLSNYGVRLFAVEQRGRTLSIESADTAGLRLFAYWTMDALHRSLFIQPPEALADSLPRSWERKGEWLSERRTSTLRVREFSDDEGATAWTPVTIHYPDDATEGIEIRNERCGYQARLVVLGDERSSSPAAGARHHARDAAVESSIEWGMERKNL